jgi:hypothetical protein
MNIIATAKLNNQNQAEGKNLPPIEIQKNYHINFLE